MKKLWFMGLFSLLMTVAFSGQSVSFVSFVTPAYASDEPDSSDSDKDSADKDSADKDSEDMTVAFGCPEGVSTCYRADGSEYVDINNLEATASGDDEEDDDKDSFVRVVSPNHFRSF
ncbi:MAG: hypothetical protein JKY87_05425 [Mariprofundus sp.]|nr:hypothetical protein [Mariprofundus sp.]